MRNVGWTTIFVEQFLRGYWSMGKVREKCDENMARQTGAEMLKGAK